MQNRPRAGRAVQRRSTQAQGPGAAWPLLGRRKKLAIPSPLATRAVAEKRHTSSSSGGAAAPRSDEAWATERVSTVAEKRQTSSSSGAAAAPRSDEAWATERVSNTSGSRAAASRALLELLNVQATPDDEALAAAERDLASGSRFPAARIPFSDVVARKKRPYFFNRQWVERDLGYAAFFAPLHAFFFLLAPFTASPDALRCALVGFILTGWLGIGLGYHRLFSHRSFRAHRTVERALAFLGACAFEGDVGEWTKMHLSHHVCSDKEGDRHSPRDGFWHSHAGWLFDNALSNARGLDAAGPSTRRGAAAAAGPAAPAAAELEAVGLLAAAEGDDGASGSTRTTTNAATAIPWFVKDDPQFYNALRTRYMPLQAGQLAFFVALALAMRDPGILVWGYAGRLIVTFHATWAVNSVAHVWGDRNFESDDGSRDNALLALLVGGDGWHNSHHAFPRSARHGLAAPEWADFNWVVVRALQRAGLAWDVQLPPAEAVERKRLRREAA